MPVSSTTKILDHATCLGVNLCAGDSILTPGQEVRYTGVMAVHKRRGEARRTRRGKVAATVAKGAIAAAKAEAETAGAFGTTRSVSAIATATGLSIGHVSRLRARKRRPSMRAAKTIADYLGISVDQLLGYCKQ